MRILLLSLIIAAAMAADVKPLVPNGSGGWMPVQVGQTIFAPLTSGAFSAIPAASSANLAQVYWATDSQTLYRSNGSTWIALATAATPGGPATGDLSGNYPAPVVAGIQGLAVPSPVTGAFLKVNGSGAWEFVSYGSGADQPAAGNDARFTNARAPTGAATGDLAGSYPAPTVAGILGLSLPGVVANSFPKITAGGAWEWVTYGSGPDTPVAGNDSRLSNARAPTGAAGGDLSGSYPNPSVSAWLGAALGSTAPTAGNVMLGQGSQWLSVGLSGDVALASSGATTLASVGSSGTYTQVTTDSKGRVTAGSSPTTLAGLGITNGVQNYGSTPGILSGIFSARPGASIAGRVYVTTDTGALYEDTGSAWTLLIPALTGDLTTSGVVATLATSGVGAGTYGSATQCPVFSVDAKGRITGVTNTTITAGAFSGILPLANGGTGSNLSATGGSGYLLKQTSSGGLISVAALLNADLPLSGVTAGTYQSMTVNAQGIVTGATNPTTLAGYGITNAVMNGGNAPAIFTGADGSKPAAGTLGRLYFASDTAKIYYDNGSSWLLELPALTGDITTAGTVATLAASGVSSGTYGSAAVVPVITFDAKGRATVATTATIAIPASAITSGTLAVAQGGTGTASWTNGQVLIGRTSDGSAVPATLTAGTGISVTNAGASITIATNPSTQAANVVLAGPVSGGAALPAFRALVAADIPGLPASAITSGTLGAANGGTGINGASAANGSLLIGNGSGYTAATITAGSGVTVTNAAGSITIAASGGGSGTVTSVGLSLPSIITVSGSPVTASGTLTGTLATQSANQVFAGPSSGGASAPTFRAMVASDVPSLPASQITSGQIGVPNGGTGDATLTAYAVLTGGTTSTGALQQVSGVGTSGQVLTSNGASALPSWTTVGGTGTVTSVAATVPSFLSVSGSPITGAGTLAISLSGTALPVANGGTGITSDVAYAIFAGGTSTGGAHQQISGLGTSGQVLTSNGASALPTWQNAGGGGSIGGSIASTQVAVGSGSNTIAGSSAFTWDGTFLAVTANTGNSYTAINKANVGFYFSSDYAGGSPHVMGIDQTLNSTTTSNDLIFWSYFTGGAPTEGFRLHNAGNLVFHSGCQIVAAQSTTSLASINLPPGAAPSAPNSGDMWTTSAGVFAFIGSTTLPLINATTTGAISINAASLVTNAGAFTNFAGSSVGTFTNAPSAGNPRIYFSVTDSSGTYYVPGF